MVVEMQKFDNSLSVIIPYYNGSKFIERAINSVQSQTVKAAKLIVVNDGSLEDERRYLYSLQEKYGFIIIDKKNGGQGDARNVGVSHADSDFVCFLDQDDFYKKRHNEILLSVIPPEPNDIGFIYADLAEADVDGNIIRTSMIKEHSVHPKESINELLSKDMFILPSASLIKVSAFLRVGGFDASFTGYEDDDLFLRLFRAGYEHIFIDSPVTVWCIHSESTSYSIKMSRSRMKYIAKLVKMFPSNAGKSGYYFRDLIMPRFTSLILNDYITAIKNNSNDKNEYESMLSTYYNFVSANLSVERKEKRRLQMVLLLGKYFPRFLFLAILKLRNF